MPGGKSAELGLNPEQLGEEIVQMRRDLQDQRRFGLGIEAFGIFARREESRFQRGIGGPEAIEENEIEFREAVAPVEIGKGQAVGEI